MLFFVHHLAELTQDSSTVNLGILPRAHPIAAFRALSHSHHIHEVADENLVQIMRRNGTTIGFIMLWRTGHNLLLVDTVIHLQGL